MGRGSWWSLGYATPREVLARSAAGRAYPWTGYGGTEGHPMSNHSLGGSEPANGWIQTGPGVWR